MLHLEGRIAGRVRHWPLPDGELILGRSKDCDIVVDDPSVSRRHLSIRIEGSAIKIADLDSANGLWVDGERARVVQIEPGRWFSTGAILFTVRRSVTLESGRQETDSLETGASAAILPSFPPLDEQDYEDDLDPFEGRLLRHLIRDGPWIPAALDGLLAAVAVGGKLTGAVVLRRTIAGCTILSSWGKPPDADAVEKMLTSGAAFSARAEHGDEWSALRLQHGALGDDCVVLLQPAGAVPPGLEFVAEACARLLSETAQYSSSAGSIVAEVGSPSGFITVSDAGKRLLAEIDRIAMSDIPVLLRGESGTGKELLARRLHHRSRRSLGPFVALNCSALPEDLVEAELFGIHRGVATGVAERHGRFVQASGGTLFLDEIGDLAPSLQPKLLRALENGEVLPLGAPAPVAVNVRVVAATNTNLAEAIQTGRFRRDLLYRLAGAELSIPPLRDRPEDILPLARHFAREAAGRKGATLLGVDLDAARVLVGYGWPGNVRELRHVIFRAAALADGPILHRELLPASLANDSDPNLGDVLLGFREDWRTANERFARAYFQRLIEECDGNMTEVARRSGLGRSTLYERLKDLGLR